MSKKRRTASGSKRGSGNYRTYFTTRNGRRVYARDYGYKGWPFGQ